MQFKLRQLKNEKVFLKPRKGGVFEKLKIVPRKGLLCSGSHLIERETRKINKWIEHGPVDPKLLMKKLDDCYASYGPERKYLLDYNKITFNQRDYSNFLKSGLGEFQMLKIDRLCFDTDALPRFKPGDFWYDDRETAKRPRLDNDQSVK